MDLPVPGADGTDAGLADNDVPVDAMRGATAEAVDAVRDAEAREPIVHGSGRQTEEVVRDVQIDAPQPRRSGRAKRAPAYLTDYE